MKSILRCACATALAVAPAVASPDPAAAVPFGARSLHLHSHGHDVRVLQDWLTRLGVPTSVDGRFGRRTRRSVRRYERRNDQRVDGRVSRRQARGIRKRVAVGEVLDPAPPLAGPAAETPGPDAVIGADRRTALAPAAAPQPVKDAIAAANRLVDKPYRYGGGHGTWEDTAYDCSGTVSYVLHGGGLLDRPLASGGLETFGRDGPGQWITVYANGGHAYAVIAGLRLDTSGAGEAGPRWRSRARSPRAFVVRHPDGL